MFVDHESLKLEPKEKKFVGTVNVFDVDLKDHRQDHQLLFKLNASIWVLTPEFATYFIGIKHN
jgi:hypothetical protein